jgi:hypothetical protein
MLPSAESYQLEPSQLIVFCCHGADKGGIYAGDNNIETYVWKNKQCTVV